MKNIRDLSVEDISEYLKSHNQPVFRAKQIYQWLWHKRASAFSEMSNIPIEIREKLSNDFELKPLKILNSFKSADGTIKVAFELWDGNIVEGVLIPSADRITACVSSQVGCSLNCSFCATGYLPYKRNLDAGEIFDQVYLLKKLALEKNNINLSNIVFMGMGEPLLNYSNLLKSIEHITSPVGLAISPQRITVSTSGIAKMIKKLGDDNVKFNLALSLHYADNDKRTSIMPINESNNLEMLAEALEYFYSKTKTRVTLEYCMISEINDTEQDALNLANFARKVKCKINLIEYNPIDNALYKPSTNIATQNFIKILEQKKHIVNLRRSRGKDINAACGQLANKLLK
ncbi:MAG: 23S rRNA (adenine(2503)-C(2))-methyltransferase RlmN [Bacteroidetes bacterium]|nr:23S rRNA (adenine(2503)-C(2))-methyltransferase RlmN [Bacteroidota bacterium]